MKNRLKIITRVGLFCIIFVLMLLALNVFFQPAWPNMNNYYTVNGFYEEPDNTIETLFLGASVTSMSFNPMQLYEDYGICAYNLGTEQQPLLTSYYWLEEVYRLHKDTLKTVIFDVSELRDTSSESFYHKSLDGMKFSKIKYRAIRDYAKGDLKKMVEFSIPLISYHSRWDELSENDIDKYGWDAVNGTRGFRYSKRSVSYTDPYKTTVLDESEKPKELVNSEVAWFEKMAQFCKEKGIKLVLTKTLTRFWNSGFHNAVQILADKHGLDFIDFNYGDAYDSLNYTIFDDFDTRHHNWYGAAKVTKSIGEYLVNNGLATDIRGNEHWSYMQEQSALYKTRISDRIDLFDTTDVASYLKTAIKGDSAVFISVSDEGSEALTDEQRKEFASLGLTKLSELKFRQSYLAVVQNGKVIYEQIKWPADQNKKPLEYRGKLPNGTKYVLKSGGYEHGKLSSCIIGGEETMENLRGINITVYKTDVGEVIDKTNFDTYAFESRDVYTLDSVNVLNDILAMQEVLPGSYKANIIKYDKALKDLNAKYAK